MAIILDNGANPTAVNFNGQDMTAVVVNGTQVWTKPAVTGTWKNAWSGVAYLFDTDFSIQYAHEIYSFTYTFAGLGSIAQKTIQVDAEFKLYEFQTGNIWDADYNYAAKNNSYEMSNLPWSTYPFQGLEGFSGGVLYPLVADGANAKMTAESDYSMYWNTQMMEGFTVTNIWYYDR